MSDYKMVTPLEKQPELLSSVKNVILVASGKGGVGKSTMAANLAISLAREGYRTGLLDADVYGPSVPILFDIKNQRPVAEKENEKARIIPIEKYGVKIMSIGLLTKEEDAMIWRGPMASKTLKQVIEDTKWGELDFLLIDMPPGTGDIAITMAQDIKKAKALIVITPQQLAVADGRKAGYMFSNPHVQTPVLGIIENMAWFTPANHPDERYFIFGKGGGQQLADELNAPLIGQIPLVMEIEETSDSGKNIFLTDTPSVHKAFQELTNNILKKVN
ncbi:Mrp/NBP35 family ATP-binding protein [Carboxylicivirga linearis]|uniref:Iron-sulfur cluster carrier protein n=1 Tax=Carboxylicivirga linearis TaxID=1628157 RepID=A0ABS5JYF8_9BACT|nr:Mrp/NBP35 family ATP-binding protein [Carboxylicivirga linearis]MBS2099341.1 Mrp/NBP35 family ATP-binding protein [Carboxylicivirga linearis]